MEEKQFPVSSVSEKKIFQGIPKFSTRREKIDYFGHSDRCFKSFTRTQL
jgi:hypothetical protein